MNFFEQNRKTSVLALSFLFSTLVVPTHAHAANLSEVALFIRCYTQLTGKRPPLSNAARQRVKAGTQSALDACTTLLEKPKFITSGANEGRIDNTNDPEAIAVLNHLNDFHRSWFLSDNLEAAVPDQNAQIQRDKEYNDETQPALHVTRALFSDLPYSEIVTNSSEMEALRSNGVNFEKTWDGTSGYNTDFNVRRKTKFVTRTIAMDSSGQCFPSGTCFGNYQTPGITILNTELVQTGDMLGVRKVTLNAGKMAQGGYSDVGGGVGTIRSGVYLNTRNVFHESFGAGFVGSKMYLNLNLGRPNSTFSDGGLDLPRRWSRAVLSEGLCRDTPTIRSSDATIYVQGNSTLPFRNSRQCMECHASLDPLASVARAITRRPTFYGDDQRMMDFSSINYHPVTMPARAGVTDMDNDFAKRPPDGTLFFRSYSGAKVNIPITGAASTKDAFTKLGNALASTEDLYVCAASRYYQLMTGIKVSLQDIGDPSRAALSEKDLFFRNEVVKLGLSLKQHQSLRKLIGDIMKTDTYRKIAPSGSTN